MTNIQELLSKPVWQMTGEEFIMLSGHASGQPEAQPQPVADTNRKYVYGILGIAKLFGCSLPTANRIKKKREDRQGHHPDRAQDYRGRGTCP